MTWFWIALAAPLLYAAVNHADKYLISKYFSGTTVGPLIIFSTIFALLVVAVISVISPTFIQVAPADALLLALSGALAVISIIFYLYALGQDETSIVMLFTQTIPIFGFIVGYLFLGETLTFLQIIGTILVIVGAGLVSFKLDGRRVSFRGSIALLMTGCCLFYALSGVAFKFVAADIGFWSSFYWLLVGKAGIGILIFLLIAPYRRQFFHVLETARHLPVVVSLNWGSDLATTLAEGLIYYATLLAPIALVYAISSVQPVFVFLLGILLTLFWPKIAQESLARRALIQKTVAIILAVIGGILLNF